MLLGLPFKDGECRLVYASGVDREQSAHLQRLYLLFIENFGFTAHRTHLFTDKLSKFLSIELVDRLIHEVASHQSGFNSDIELLHAVFASSSFKEVDGFQGVSLGVSLVFLELVVGEHHTFGGTHLHAAFATDILDENFFVFVGIQPLANGSAFFAALLHKLVLIFCRIDEEDVITLCVFVDYDSFLFVVIVTFPDVISFILIKPDFVDIFCRFQNENLCGNLVVFSKFKNCHLLSIIRYLLSIIFYPKNPFNTFIVFSVAPIFPVT